MNEIKQITIISGKGGTGKTSILAAFAQLAKNKVIADCDVDAADLHLLIKPTDTQEEDFKSMKKTQINKEKCNECGKCIDNCRFNAIKNYTVDQLSCEGCGVCQLVCPQKAVSLHETIGGKLYLSNTTLGPLCHARLNPGEEASGKLVTKVRNNAKKIADEKKHDLILIDGSPGIGCPVIASIGGVDLVLIITEPTLSGLHDLKRILDVAKHFKVNAQVVINKSDINTRQTEKIKKHCETEGVKLAGEIPYDITFTRAQVAGKNIIEYTENEITKKIRGIWNEINNSLRQ